MSNTIILWLLRRLMRNDNEATNDRMTMASTPPNVTNVEPTYTWRREESISIDRQADLRMRLLIKPNVNKGQYPFSGKRLSRADIEWLLVNHDNGNGPVDWDDIVDRKRWGLDLRAAIIDGVDLSGLPLARLRGGVSGVDWHTATDENRKRAALSARGTIFTYSRMEGSILTYADLEGALLHDTHLEDIDAFGMRLNGPLANLNGCFFSPGSKLLRVELASEKGIGANLINVHWNGTDLTGIDWSAVRILRKEFYARQGIRWDGVKQTKQALDRDFEEAVFSYQQLSAVLASQGLAEHAARFSYRARLMERQVFFRSRRWMRYSSSLIFDITTGYGHKLWRSFATYVVTIGFFAVANLLAAKDSGLTLSLRDAMVLSMSSFHGRGLAPPAQTLSSPVLMLGSVEGLIGLIVEIILISTVTQRLFRK